MDTQKWTDCITSLVFVGIFFKTSFDMASLIKYIDVRIGGSEEAFTCILFAN